MAKVIYIVCDFDTKWEGPSFAPFYLFLVSVYGILLLFPIIHSFLFSRGKWGRFIARCSIIGQYSAL